MCPLPSGGNAPSPTPSPRSQSLFGSVHATRSPFQWDRPQEARQPTQPWPLPWRRSQDGGDGAERSSRSLPQDSDLRQPLLQRRSMGGYETGADVAAGSNSTTGFSLAGEGRPKPASFSASRPPPAPSTNAASGGERVSSPTRGSLTNALRSISESVRGSIPGSLISASWHSGEASTHQPAHRDAAAEQLQPWGSVGLGSTDLEAALPPDFEQRIHSDEHPAYRRRLDAASDRASEEADDSPAKAGVAQRIGIDCVTGVINAIVSLPVMMSFAVIIFNDAFFAPWAGSLVRLVILCAALHQAVFTAFSTIKFAVGQVQDVGLIFMSAIATSVVGAARDAKLSDDETLGTVLVTLAASTLLVGILIVAVGQLRLASVVQYMPLSVIGGYLGYVGYFMAASGASLATGKKFGSPQSWLQLASEDVCLKLAPAVAGACLLWLVTHKIRSPWALPAVLVVMPAVFFLVLYAVLHSDLAAARDAGWVTKSQGASSPKHFWDVWKLFNLWSGGLLWSALPRQLPTVLALAFVVAFGSSLDVAAIQQDNPAELDYNKELTTVGISNIVAGLSGAGYTGSYIFSQTIFSMRAAVSTRASGIVIVLCELGIFVAPVSVVEYLPVFFFGSLMLWIGYEIVKDWLVSAYERMTSFEYLTLGLTFAAIMALGLELGIAAGLVLAALFFSVQYAKVNITAFNVVPSRSGVVRTFQQRTLLEVFSGRIVAVSLSGYIFFGSSVKIGEKVCQIVRHSLLASEEVSREQTAAADASAELPGVKAASDAKELIHEEGALEGSLRNRAAAAVFLAPRFCLLDFRQVSGMDGTAARQFSTLRRRLQQMGIELVITHLPSSRPQVGELLLANGVVAASGARPQPGQCRAFDSLDEGLHECEEALLDCAVHYGLCRRPSAHATLAEVLQQHLEYPRPLLPGSQTRYGRAAREMVAFMTPRTLQPGEVLFRPGEAPDELYVIESGAVLCHMERVTMSPLGRRKAAAAGTDVVQEMHKARLFQYGSGFFVGELDFFLQRPRSFLAQVNAPVSLLVLPRAQFERMAAQAPALSTLLQAAVLRCTSLSAAHALEALEKAAGGAT